MILLKWGAAVLRPYGWGMWICGGSGFFWSWKGADVRAGGLLKWGAAVLRPYGTSA